MNLKGKVALITGGARIGLTVAHELAKRGCDIAFTYRTSRSAAAEVQKKSGSFGNRVRVYRCNLTKDQNIKALIKRTMSDFQRLDFLIPMVSTYERVPFGKITNESWERALASNLKSIYTTALVAAPFLKKTSGRIITFTDWLVPSHRPRYKGYLPYYTAKFGLLGLTQGLALELAPHVLVNAIAPGPILPPKSASSMEVSDVIRSTPLGRWGGAEEIAKAVLFLIETNFVTGECIRVDGGRHLY